MDALYTSTYLHFYIPAINLTYYQARPEPESDPADLNSIHNQGESARALCLHVLQVK